MTKNPSDDKEEIRKKIEEAMKTGKENARQALSRQNEKNCPFTPRQGKCRVCNGLVTENFSKRFDSRSGPMVYGPGSRSQFRWASSGLFCQDCGLSYHRLPKKED